MIYGYGYPSANTRSYTAVELGCNIPLTSCTGLIKAYSNYHANTDLWYLPWHDLSNTTLDRVKVLSKTFDWKNLDFIEWLKGIESIMEWGRVHPDKKQIIPDILQNVVCLCKVPDDYIKMVLVPHLKALLGVEEVELRCKVHETRSSAPHAVQTTALTNSFYLVQDTSVRLYSISNTYCDLDLKKTSPSPLSISSNYYSEERFVLFDREQVMEQYPLYQLCDLSLIELRKLFVKYKQLSVMTFYKD